MEIADQPVERTIGLMNRSELEPRGGMLFVFDTPHIIEMWMKNTLISLDMVFADKNPACQAVWQQRGCTPRDLGAAFLIGMVGDC